MLFFLLFIVLMPALTYADYRLYGKKDGRDPGRPAGLRPKPRKLRCPAGQLMARQKKTDTLVCAVLCIVAFILGVYTSTAGGIM